MNMITADASDKEDGVDGALNDIFGTHSNLTNEEFVKAVVR